MKRRRSMTVTISLPVGMVEQLREVVREEGQTMSAILREIIRPSLESRKPRVQEREEGLRTSQTGPVDAISREFEDIMNDDTVPYGYENLEAPGRVEASGPVSGDTITVFGIDFTSAPTRRKPILCLECRLVGDVLEIVGAQPWRTFRTFAEFEAFLQAPPPANSEAWIAGADLPFALSIRFMDNMQWSRGWGDYIDRHLAPLCRQGRQGRQAWRRILDDYKEHRPFGDKEHLRRTDELAGSLSPQKQYGVPVGLMLLEGAPRLRDAGVTIPGLQEGSPERMVVEAYPGVAVDNLMREKLSWSKLQKAEKLIDVVEKIENLHGHEYDATKKTVKNGELIVTGEKSVAEHAAGLGGTFTYCTLGAPVELDKVLTGESLPPYESLGAALFHMATNHALDPATVREADFYLGEVERQHVWLIYKPALDWLKSPDAALTLSRAKEFASTAPDKRHLVFAPARFVSQKMLAEQNIPVEFVPLPFALYRIDRS